MSDSDGSADEAHDRPTSLQECLSLLTLPLSRDHFLVKGKEDRNRIRVSDVITGTGTECQREAAQRKKSALQNCHKFVDEISHRNSRQLGLGLVNALLGVETDVDEDGVPLEEDESKVCQLVGRILVEIQSKTREPSILEEATSNILANSEVLLYHKYKLLKSVRFGAEALSNSLASKSYITNIVPFKPEQSLAVIRDRYMACIAKSTSSDLDRILSLEDTSLFVNKVLVNELVDTEIVMSKTADDTESLMPMIRSLVVYLKKSSMSDEEFVKALLRLLTCSKQVLLDVAEDESIVALLRIVLKQIMNSRNLSSEVLELVASIHQCISF